VTALIALILIAPVQPAIQGRSTKNEAVFGHIAWRITDTRTSKKISEGKRVLHLRDFKIKPMNGLTSKSIALGAHFFLEYAPEESLKPGKSGFGITAERDDMSTFCWEWFTVRNPTLAIKLQETGEMGIKFANTRAGYELVRMEFRTDVSLRVNSYGDAPGAAPRWRVDILKSSVINWPSLVKGKVVPNGVEHSKGKPQGTGG
jgi:hypothetical protein